MWNSLTQSKAYATNQLLHLEYEMVLGDVSLFTSQAYHSRIQPDQKTQQLLFPKDCFPQFHESLRKF